MSIKSGKDDAGPYELYYWPTIQGRGEFVRLALEEAGADYIDVARLPARQGGGEAALMRFPGRQAIAHIPFAPPFLKCGELVIGQTANILQFLGPRLGLAPRAAAGRIWAHQLQLTIADLVTEVHDTHHPIAVSLYYEDQKPAARRRGADFLENRLPKFLDYFEQVLGQNGKGSRYLVGARLSYVDLSIFQVIEGLYYAFPKAMARLAPGHGCLMDLHGRVAARPRIAAYLSSKRRLPFSEEGIFRHYPELDR
ncbi:MAG: glutathione S-transferase [Noviherbaspirillum sp.]